MAEIRGVQEKYFYYNLYIFGILGFSIFFFPRTKDHRVRSGFLDQYVLSDIENLDTFES
jgi:hypothetical protein